MPMCNPQSAMPNAAMPEIGREAENEVGKDQHGETESQNPAPADTVRDHAHRIGGRGVDDVHHHENERHQGQ